MENYLKRTEEKKPKELKASLKRKDHFHSTFTICSNSTNLKVATRPAGINFPELKNLYPMRASNVALVPVEDRCTHIHVLGKINIGTFATS